MTANAPATLYTRTTSSVTTDSETSGQPLEQEVPVVVAPVPYEKVVKVKSGNTLSGLLTGAGIDRIEAADIVTAFSDAFNPRKIRAG